MAAEVLGGPPADVLDLGPVPSRRSRRRFLLVVLLAVAVLAGLGTWRAWPKPRPDFTADDLAGAYAGMVRADGTNEVSRLTAGDLTEPPATIDPDRCTPLFETTLSNQFPATAQDGVSTYWLKEGSASISLVTYRYLDGAAARRQFAGIDEALRGCVGTSLRVDRRRDVSVVPQEVPAPAGAEDYVSYLVSSPPASTRFTIDVARLSNTVSWQYRYDYQSRATYSPLAAQQLMSSLVSQLRDVQDSHR